MEGRLASSNKRSYSHYEQESSEYRNVRQKRRGGGSDRIGENAKSQVEDVVYRILCPGTKIGSVIGKGGSIIKSLRNETGAKIKVADGMAGADERVILISASSKEKREGKRRGSNEERFRVKETKGADPMEEDILPASQDALFKVFTRIVEGEGFEEDEDSSRNVTTRLLVPNSQIGCLLGKAGKIIEQMRAETGAQIRVLPKEQLPKFAFENDELVQLSGELSLVKKALMTISTRLYENPPRERPQTHMSFQESLLPGALIHPGAFFPQANPPGAQVFGIGPSLGGLGVPGSTWTYGSPPVAHGLHGGLHGPRNGAKDASPEGELVVRLLCPNDKVGSIIGKGGAVIRHIREETCARIKIADPIPNVDERVIIISAVEALHDQVSPSLDAVLQLQSRIAELSSENDGNTTTRFLVPSANIGCILGKKGSIIAEMRRNTRAIIRVLSKEALPKCALEDDELIQVVGDLNVARDAVIEIITRLRANLFKEHAKTGPQETGPLASSYEPRHEPSPGMFPFPGLSSQGLRSSIGSSPRTWGIQGTSGLSNLPYPGGSATAAGGVFGSTRSNTGLVASVAGTTIEISIPAGVIGSIIGKSGSNINQIRNISGAKVKLHDQKPGADKRIIEISGTPDQTQAAQSLLEAFMFTTQSQAASTAMY